MLKLAQLLLVVGAMTLGVQLLGLANYGIVAAIVTMTACIVSVQREVGALQAHQGLALDTLREIVDRKKLGFADAIWILSISTLVGALWAGAPLIFAFSRADAARARERGGQTDSSSPRAR